MVSQTARISITTRPEKRDEVYDVIDGERTYQDLRWPPNDEGEPRLSIGESILLLDEYVTKAKLSWSQERRPESHTLGVIRKIAAIAVHALEDHGAPEREGL